MGGPSGDFESKFQAYLCDDIRLLALVFCLLVFVFFFGGEGRGRKKPHPNSSHFNLFDREER